MYLSCSLQFLLYIASIANLLRELMEEYLIIILGLFSAVLNKNYRYSEVSWQEASECLAKYLHCFYGVRKIIPQLVMGFSEKKEDLPS